MGTQAVVSVVSPEGTVIAKAVTGCNGREADRLATLAAERLSAADRPQDTAKALLALAREAEYGCESCLVVQWADGFAMDAPDMLLDFLSDEESVDRWKDRFQEPEFNPRWEYGTAEYVRVVTLT